jgi:hypothetical protein
MHSRFGLADVEVKVIIGGIVWKTKVYGMAPDSILILYRTINVKLTQPFVRLGRKIKRGIIGHKWRAFFPVGIDAFSQRNRIRPLFGFVVVAAHVKVILEIVGISIHGENAAFQIFSKENITGKKAQETLDKAHITLNKNSVPYDDKSPFVTSGIRIGVPAITTRGLKTEHMQTVVEMIDKVLMHADDEQVVAAVKQDVKSFMQKFPLYPELG